MLFRQIKHVFFCRGGVVGGSVSGFVRVFVDVVGCYRVVCRVDCTSIEHVNHELKDYTLTP